MFHIITYQNLRLYDAPHYHCPSTYPSITVSSHKITRFHNAPCSHCAGIYYYLHLSLLYQISDSSCHYRTKILNSTMPHIITAPAYTPLCYCRIKSQDSTMLRSCNYCSSIYYLHLSLLYQLSDSSYHYRTKILNSTMPHIITAPAYIPLLQSHHKITRFHNASSRDHSSGIYYIHLSLSHQISDPIHH